MTQTSEVREKIRHEVSQADPQMIDPEFLEYPRASCEPLDRNPRSHGRRLVVDGNPPEHVGAWTRVCPMSSTVRSPEVWDVIDYGFNLADGSARKQWIRQVPG